MQVPISDPTCSKMVNIVRTALKGVDRVQAVMIGDRVDDIVAARKNGARAVAVGWGYSDAGELETASPDFVAETVADLVAWVQAAG